MNCTRNIICGLLLLVLLGLAGCKDCSCKDYKPETREATYCRYHRDAVWDYVETVSDVEAQKAKLAEMERLLKAVKECEALGCIEREAQADTIAPGFAAIYESANARAETEVGMETFHSWQVVLCGLNHGVADWR
ncbi:MAG: hypothetical protein V3T31_12800, partial [candidate division Zixibacteria bacterium]